MPMPKPKKEEKKEDFLARFMADETMAKEYPDNKQRYAIALQQWESASFAGFDDWIPIFQGGKQIDSNGIEHDGDILIEKAIATFDTGKHEPPVVIGHPQENAPAWGWVEGLKKQGNLLMAKFKQMQPEFIDMVQKGLFKKRSAAFYPDGSLRHVGFLGAMPPAVKGLPDVAFASNADATFEFGDNNATIGWKWTVISGIFRRLREWLIEQFGKDTAERIVSNYDIEDVGNAMPDGKAEQNLAAQYQERKNQKEVNMTDLINKLKELIHSASAEGNPTFSESDLEAAKLKAAEDAAKNEREKLIAEFAEKDRLARQEARKREILSWCESMIKDGKMTPAMVKFGIPEFLTAFAEKDDIIEFGESKEKATLYDRFKTFFETELPKVVVFKELATRDKDTGGQGHVGPKMEALIKAKMQEDKNKTYSVAFAEVQVENPDLAREYAAEIKEVK